MDPFVRIGEAVVNLPEELIEAHPEIEWRDVRRFPQLPRACACRVDPARLYDTAKQYLPELRQKRGDLLADA